MGFRRCQVLDRCRQSVAYLGSISLAVNSVLGAAVVAGAPVQMKLFQAPGALQGTPFNLCNPTNRMRDSNCSYNNFMYIIVRNLSMN